MNIKLHIPKSLKKIAKEASMKHFLLSLVATTVSIILTFGTASFVDNRKKAAAKHEMVMMILHDFNQTIALAEEADTALRKASQLQLQLSQHPERFDSLRFSFMPALIIAQKEFFETTEKIFSSSIETFSTIGNVNFVSEVSSFYSTRRKYQQIVLQKLKEDAEERHMVQSLKTLLDVSFPSYVYTNWVFLESMKQTRDVCMKMMGVSEKEMKAFSQKRTQKGNDASYNSREQEMRDTWMKAEEQLEEARKKYLY